MARARSLVQVREGMAAFASVEGWKREGHALSLIASNARGDTFVLGAHNVLRHCRAMQACKCHC